MNMSERIRQTKLRKLIDRLDSLEDEINEMREIITNMALK